MNLLVENEVRNIGKVFPTREENSGDKSSELSILEISLMQHR